MKTSWRWLIVLAIVTTICFLSDIPDLHLVREEQLPLWLKQLGYKYTVRFGTEGYFSYVLSLQPDFILHKIGHIMAFGTLGTSIYWATRYSISWPVGLTAIAAACDEWHQYYVPGRSSRFGDVILDTLAAIAFITVAKLMKCKSKS